MSFYNVFSAIKRKKSLQFHGVVVFAAGRVGIVHCTKFLRRVTFQRNFAPVKWYIIIHKIIAGPQCNNSRYFNLTTELKKEQSKSEYKTRISSSAPGVYLFLFSLRLARLGRSTIATAAVHARKSYIYTTITQTVLLKTFL